MTSDDLWNRDLQRLNSADCDPVERMEFVQRLNDAARERRFRWLRQIYPDAGAEEIREREAARRLGDQAGRMVFKDRYEYLIR